MTGPSAIGKLLHLVFLSTRSLTLGARAAITLDDGRIVLVRHTYAKGWTLPGGGVERGESALQALHREIEQETRISLTAVPVLHGIFCNRRASPRDHVLVYRCSATGPVPILKPNLEIAEVAAFLPDALPADLEPGTRARITEIRTSSLPSEDW